MSDMDKLAARLDELEAQGAFQDELFHKLNDIVARQDGEILALKRQLNDLYQRLAEVRDASSSAASDPASEVPPHY